MLIHLLSSIIHLKYILLNDWFDLYQDIATVQVTKLNLNSQSAQTISPQNGNVHVSQSYFYNMGDTGCIQVSDANKVLVELSTFVKSTVKYRSGAAVYVNKGNSIISKVCCSQCTGSSEYGKAVCYIYLDDNLGVVNKFLDSSVHQCSDNIMGMPIVMMNGHYLQIDFGKCRVKVMTHL